MKTLSVQVTLAAALAVAACSGGDAKSSTPTGNAQTVANAQGPGPGGGGGGGGGGGRGTITLAATDVTQARRGMIEDAVPVTGDLQPVERLDIRARIEGEVLNVLVREGDRVRQGQLLARFEHIEQESGAESAIADVAAARTDLATAQWNLDQTRDLFKEGAVPERDVKAGEQSVAGARARLAAAESRLRTSDRTLEDTRVLAPADGVIERRRVSNGEHVSRGTALFTLVRTNVLELTGNVQARQANRIQPGQLVRFHADGRAFTGHVARVSPTIDAASRAIAVYIQIPNADGSLKGGTFAAGRVISRTVNDAIIVPSSAVRYDQNSGAAYVFRIVGETVERTPIEVGLVDEASGIVQVANGVQEGERVVSGTVNIVARSARVTIIGGENQTNAAPQQPAPAPVPRN